MKQTSVCEICKEEGISEEVCTKCNGYKFEELCYGCAELEPLCDCKDR